MAKVTMDGFRCERCEHQWVPRSKDTEPTVCPKCKSAYWNTPRRTDRRKAGQRTSKRK